MSERDVHQLSEQPAEAIPEDRWRKGIIDSSEFAPCDLTAFLFFAIL